MHIDQFCRYLYGRGMSPKTIDRRRMVLRTFTTHVAPLPLGQVTTTMIEEWLATKRAPRTRHAYRSDLRVFYGWATKRGVLDRNPAVDVDPIKVPRSLPRPFGDEAQTLLQHGSRRVRRMVVLGMYCGLRCAEIAALDADDLWLGRDQPAVIVRAGKGGRDRVVPLHPDAVALLRGAPRHGPLFAGRNGQPMQAKSVSGVLKRHLRRCGIDGVPHQLRHTFGTEVARASGGDMVVTAELMGHTSMSTTLGYVRLTAGRGAEVIANLYSDAA